MAPLRRATDRVEDAVALLLVVAAVGVLVGALAFGLDVQQREAERARRLLATTTPVTAVLVQDAAAVGGEHGAQHPPAVAAARWAGPAGEERVAVVSVPAGTPAGSLVELRVDRAGRLAPEPASDPEVLVVAVVAAAAVLVCGGAVLAGTWLAVRAALAALNARVLDREWERLGRQWGSGSPG